MRKCKPKVCAWRCVISVFMMRFSSVFCFIDRNREEKERFTSILLFFQVLRFLERHVFLTWVCLHQLMQVREENLWVNWYRKISTTSTSYWPGVLHPKMVQRIIMTLNLHGVDRHSHTQGLFVCESWTVDVDVIEWICISDCECVHSVCVCVCVCVCVWGCVCVCVLGGGGVICWIVLLCVQWVARFYTKLSYQLCDYCASYCISFIYNYVCLSDITRLIRVEQISAVINSFLIWYHICLCCFVFNGWQGFIQN